MSPHFPDPLGRGLNRPKPPTFGAPLPRPIPTILGNVLPAHKRSVFVSYHHTSDQHYYDLLSNVASSRFQLMRDNSLRLRIDSNNHDYIIQRIRDNHITGSSCTIVLCGAETYQRKYVDWEIKASLDKEHGIVAVYLPSARREADGIRVPDRLVPNIESGYAYWVSWESFTQSADNFKACIESAIRRSSDLVLKRQIYNPKEIKKQNG